MQEIIIVDPTVAYNPNNITYNLDNVDAMISELENRYRNYVITDKKEAKELCKELKKVADGLNKKGIEIEKKASEGIKKFRTDLKERQKRVEDIRSPIWDVVKPQPIPKEKKKIGVPVKVCYMFEGDSEYLSDMISTAEFNGIKITEVKF